MCLKTSPSIRKATAAAIIAVEGAICPLCKWGTATELHESVPARGRISSRVSLLLRKEEMS